MSETNAVPMLVANSVAEILKPYGVDFHALLQGNSSVQYVTPRQASSICGLSAKTLRSKALRGELKAVRVGKDQQRSRVLIDKRYLVTWLDNMTKTAVKQEE